MTFTILNKQQQTNKRFTATDKLHGGNAPVNLPPAHPHGPIPAWEQTALVKQALGVLPFVSVQESLLKL